MSDETPQAALAAANRILARENVLDAFGHVSVRHPNDPLRFYLSRSLPPELVTEGDIVEFDKNSEPVGPCVSLLYSERVIHGGIYRARPDVNAICHHHAAAIMPFCLAGDLKLRVVTQLGATIGPHVPMWERDAFGSTNHLVVRQEEADSLADCLGPHRMVLMKRHGATVVGKDLRELAFRSIYGCRDAELQLRALAYGSIDVFTPDEIALACKFPEATLSRAWALWRSRLP